MKLGLYSFGHTSLFLFSCWNVLVCSFFVFKTLLLLEKCSLSFSSVQFSRSVVSDSSQPHESQHARPPCLSITNSQSLPKLMSVESVMPSSHLILCRPLLLLPLIPLSIRGFSKGSYLCMCTNLYVRSRRWCSWMPAQPCSWVSLRSESECCPLEVLWCSALQPWGGCSSTLGQRSCSRSSVLHLIQRGE